jgi:hypothetical protein
MSTNFQNLLKIKDVFIKFVLFCSIGTCSFHSVSEILGHGVVLWWEEEEEEEEAKVIFEPLF